MKMKEIVKNNFKLYIVMAVIIILGTFGISFAITMNDFEAIAINSTAATLDADITYDTGYSSTVTSSGNMLPISDNLVTGIDVTDSRVLKVKFNVSGVDSNPTDTIFDIAMYVDKIDCELRTEELKWRLYRSNTLISEGNLSPLFDTMDNNRLVLTDTQEDLTTTATGYTFLLWISESCTGDITECNASMDQSQYLNRVLNGSIKIELATGSKKELTRVTGSELSCDYTEVAVPLCNSLTYNGEEQEFISTSSTSTISNSGGYRLLPLGVSTIASTSSYTINNNTGINAGKYPVILKLEDGYKWTDGSTDDKCIYCEINKKNLTVTTLDQTIDYGDDISRSISNVNVTNLVDGHTFDSVLLSSDIVDAGTGTISSSNAVVLDSSGNDVTSNYNIKYVNSGTVTINCINSSVLPSVSDKIYTGEVQTGITGGSYVTIEGTTSATFVGNYSAEVSPYKNYCWSDGTSDSETLNWSINKIYTIEYNANGGTGAPSSQTKTHGESLTLSSKVPTRSGYVFLGWSTSSVATSATYEAGGTYSTNADTTLYAVWKFALAVGDYVTYISSTSSYSIVGSSTGCTWCSETLKPSELTLWRVLNINDSGTIELISEYVSSTKVSFYSLTGYLNYVGYLNVIASQYENSVYTVGSRYFGYNGQTEYLTNDTTVFTNPAPWTVATSNNDNESKGGGDKLYTTDYDRVVEVLGTDDAYAVNDLTTVVSYLMSGRAYFYSGASYYGWGNRFVSSYANSTWASMYYYYSDGKFYGQTISLYVRPIVILKAGLVFEGQGTSASPWTIVG